MLVEPNVNPHNKMACYPGPLARFWNNVNRFFMNDYSACYLRHGEITISGLVVNTFASFAPRITDYLSSRTFLEVVRHWIHEIEREALTIRITNVTFRVIYSDGAVRNLSFPRNALHNLEETIENMQIADYEALGSDTFTEKISVAHLYTSWFKIMVLTTDGGAGESYVKNTLCYSVRSWKSNGDCLNKCLEHLSGNVIPQSELQGIHDVNAIASLYGISVGVYEDRFNIEFDRRSTTKNKWGTELVIRSWSPMLRCGHKVSKNKLLYHDNHYSVINHNYKPQTCYCMITGELVGVRKHLTNDQIEFILEGKGLTEDETDSDILYYFFDYETTYDNTGKINPYAWAVSKWSSDKLIRTTADYSNSTFDLIDYLRQEAMLENNKKRYLIGFNNSRFDNYILLTQALNYENTPRLCIFAESSIINMNILGFIVRDVQRFVQTNLRDACASFGCEITKGTLDHELIQADRFRGGNYIERHKATIIEYVRKDVESTANLFFKVKSAIKTMVNTDINSHITLSSLIYKTFSKYNSVDMPIVTAPDIDTFIRSAIIGGRTQIFELGKIVADKTVVSLDMTSEYPYVLCTKRFPIGQPIYTPSYISGKIGVYSITITEQPAVNIMPKRREDQSLDWEYDGDINIIATSVDIELLRKNRATIQISSGYYWEEDATDIFNNFLRPMINRKMEIDAGNVAHPALRNMCKLGPNGLSGKLVQRLFPKLVSFISTDTQLLNFTSKVHDDYCMEHISAKYFIGTGTKRHIENTIPSIWGVLVYSYSRSIMYDFIMLFRERYGMDTDSLFTSESEYIRVKAENPSLFGDDLGQFKEELHKQLQAGDVGPFGIYINKKTYVNYVIRDNKEHIIKIRAKGINIAKDKIITNSSFINRYDNTTVMERFDEYYNKGYRTINIDDFHKLARGETIHILCSNIRKQNVRLLLNTEFKMKKISKSA